ncbi:MAG: N-succinylarginine dihydrolase [Pseudomonadota bacterium]
MRLRVVCDPATVDPRFLLDEGKADLLERTISETWPEQIDPTDLGSDTLLEQVTIARATLLSALGVQELG